MSKEQLFGVMLEDYDTPRYNPRCKLYVGTRQELLNFCQRMEQKGNLSLHYKELIKNIRNYPHTRDATHMVCGQEWPVLLLAHEIERREYTLDNHNWVHITSCGNAYYLSAKAVWVSYILVECGNLLALCGKCSFDDVALSTPGMGWIHLGGEDNCIPGMMYYEPYGEEACVKHMSLYGCFKTYLLDKQKDEALENLPDLEGINLQPMTAEILGVK